MLFHLPLRTFFSLSIQEAFLCLIYISYVLKLPLILSNAFQQGGKHFTVRWYPPSFFLIYLFYLFIFGCTGSSLLHAGFLYLRRAGATLGCGARASHCGGFSCCKARALGTRASVVVARGLSSCGSRALERRLSSCGARA